MGLIIDENGAVVVNDAPLQGAPALLVRGSDVRFTNAAGGSLVSTSNSVAALILEAPGTIIVNAAGGLIRSGGYPYLSSVAILGSSGSDTIINEGRIDDRVNLGDGDDLFVERSTAQSNVNMGGGDDVFRMETESLYQDFAIGGAGYDRLIIAGSIGVIYSAASGFEQLEVGARVSNLVNFSNYQSILLEAGGYTNFLNSKNPAVVLTLAGNSVTIGPGSSFAGVVGSDVREAVRIGSGFQGASTISGDVVLGGGDDHFQYDWAISADAAPVLGGTIDGGAGRDDLLIVAVDGKTVDLANFINFEALDAGAATSIVANLRLVNANGLVSITSDLGGTLVLASSVSPEAVLNMLDESRIVLEATTIIGALRSLTIDSVQGGGLNVSNDGQVLGNVTLSERGDTYQGLAGGVGGTLYAQDGDDLVYAGAGARSLDGGAGNDGFYFGSAFSTQHDVVGGSGIDTIALQGNYADLSLGSVREVETILMVSGSDRRFGATGADLHEYRIRSNDGNIASNTVLTVQAAGLELGESLDFDGAAEVDGHFRFFAGRGTDRLTGGQGSDGFFFGADLNFTGADRVDGGAGMDSLALRGNYVGAGAVLFEDASFQNIEVLTFLSGHSNEYGGFIDTGGFDYQLMFVDGNVRAGQRLDLIAITLRANESLSIDGSMEKDGAFRILSGAGHDRLVGGNGADYLYGSGGADRLDGGAGADIFAYRSVGESQKTSIDEIIGFAAGDRIDLSAIDADQDTLGDNAFAFIGDQAFQGRPGELRVAKVDAGWRVEGDVDGDGVPDLSIHIVTDLIRISAFDFIL